MAKASADCRETRLIEIGPDYPCIVDAATAIAALTQHVPAVFVLDVLEWEGDQGRIEIMRVRPPRGWSTDDGDFATIDFAERWDGLVECIDQDGAREVTNLRVVEPRPTLPKWLSGSRFGSDLVDHLEKYGRWPPRAGGQHLEGQAPDRLKIEPTLRASLKKVHVEAGQLVRCCRRYQWPVLQEWLPAPNAVAAAATNDTVVGRYPPMTKAAQERWYKDYVANQQASGMRAGREARYEAAQAHFGQTISYARLDELHKKFSPPAWQTPGKPRGQSRSKRDERADPSLT